MNANPAKILSALALLVLLASCSPARAAQEPSGIPVLRNEQLEWLGDRIFQNECNRKEACLTAWNEGEEFPSLGIGHFIWYRQGQTAPFMETFPSLLKYLQQHYIVLPSWLQQQTAQPWQDRKSFLAAQQEPQLQELRQLLANTKALQTAFIVERFRQLLTTPGSPLNSSPLLQQRMVAIARSKIPYGLYALIDYVHFKGDGTRTSERYQGQGWGLQQVLENMDSAQDPLLSFVKSAEVTLAQRVTNAPPDRHEERWLKGWQQRVQTYLPPTQP